MDDIREVFINCHVMFAIYFVFEVEIVRLYKVEFISNIALINFVLFTEMTTGKTGKVNLNHNQITQLGTEIILSMTIKF